MIFLTKNILKSFLTSDILKFIIGGKSFRVINCYSTSDWFLALMYRAKSWNITVAGIQPVELSSDDSISHLLHTDGGVSLVDTVMKEISSPGQKHIENFDITDIVR